jgi:hypothetical protein
MEMTEKEIMRHHHHHRKKRQRAAVFNPAFADTAEK